jgi:hypothetical protein
MPSVPMPSVAVASVRMALVPMPAPVSMPWPRADHEQHGCHDEDSDPSLPPSHGLTSVLI